MLQMVQEEELIPLKAIVCETGIDKDDETDKEIASAMRALLLAALTLTVISPLVLVIADVFHLSIFVLR
jgi:hypothetical protein